MENNLNSREKQAQLEWASQEQVHTYENLERFFVDWGGNENKKTLDDITDFVYRVYPTYFLQGICYNGKFFVISNGDACSVEPSLINHHPTRYTRMRLSMFIRTLARESGWLLQDRDIANIILVCSADFSEDYMEFFPYTVRIFTGNEDKRRIYRTAFDGRPVEFSVIQFIEPQSSEEIVVGSKLSDVEDTEPEQTEIGIVDDTGVSLYAFGGSPGAGIKSFMEGFTPNSLARLLNALGEKRGHLNIALGATYVMRGSRQRIVIEAKFPIDWGISVSERDQKSFDDCITYKGEVLREIKEPPHQVLLEWLWHRFRRRLSTKI